MQELTREQEAAIARLAIDNPSVAVAPQGDGTVQVETATRRMILNEDGQATAAPIKSAYMALPIDLFRRLLGDDVIDAALTHVADARYPDHALATKLGEDVEARILELLATSDAVRECGLGPAPVEAL